ncbi:hypothetical protein K1T71_001102 [Dendrolimus kikuchii]|uniref:Uncharacterized protein n=1 Tax=Dendrolimus kikuchii TaxID=765133 RepID=A0ACC1DGZ1_9NEOP|nr:hypothetical protein K1T71_001102 [Dendrolimus kikuchii]
MVKPVNLLDLGSDDFQKFMDSFDYVFSDCDGVIWTRTPLPGSGKFFELIKNRGKDAYFVSNNSIKSEETYTKLFEAVGIEDGFNRLTIPSVAIMEYLKSVNFNKSIYCVTCSETQKVLERNGFKCKSGPLSTTENLADYLSYIEDDEEIGAVVIDSDFRVNIPKMYKSITYLKRPDVLFINGATDRIVPLKPGLVVFGTTVITDVINTESKREPIVLGKPSKLFGQLAMKRAGVTDPSRVLFIGDMIEQDIGLGKNCGFKTMLVLTNATEDQMLSSDIRPDYYAPNLGSLVPLLEE